MILSTVVAEAIKQMIVSGEYKAGDQLPNETELANLLNVSRPTVREAIKVLISRNVVTIKRGRGTFVNDLPGITDDPLGLDYSPEEMVIRDLCELRYYLDPFVAALAAKRADKKGLSKMGSIISNMYQCKSIIQDASKEESARQRAREMYCNCELLFHGLIYELSDNIIIKRLQPAILKSIQSFYMTIQNDPEYDYALSCNCHDRIYLAIKSGNPQVAYRCMMEHILIPGEHMFDIQEELSADLLIRSDMGDTFREN